MKAARRLLGLLALGLPLACATLTPAPLERWQAETTALRGLVFHGLVPLQWIRSAEIPELVRNEIEAALEPGYVEAYQAAYIALGTLPADIDLLETILGLQQDQLIGLYSPRVRRMYALASLDSRSETPTVVVHELIHALQHQHFPELVAVMQAVRHNDDLVTAISSALEGDATLSVLPLISKALARDRPAAEGMRDSMLRSAGRPGSEFASVPRLVRDSQTFPYAHGVVLAADAFSRGGNAGLDRLLSAPPLSTRAVIESDPAQIVDFVEFPDELGERLEALACRAGHHNVAGVLTLGVLLDDLGFAGDAAPLLGGLRGDRFQHVTCGTEPELIWITLWEDAASAQAFVDAYETLAPALALRARSGQPMATLDGTRVLILTPAVRPLGAWLIAETETRSYATLAAWLEGGCFGEPVCPRGLD